MEDGIRRMEDGQVKVAGGTGGMIYQSQANLFSCTFAPASVCVAELREERREVPGVAAGFGWHEVEYQSSQPESMPLPVNLLIRIRISNLKMAMEEQPTATGISSAWETWTDYCLTESKASTK